MSSKLKNRLITMTIVCTLAAVTSDLTTVLDIVKIAVLLAG